MKRQSGVLLPVSALPGEYSCGSFGQAAERWIDRLEANGFSVWQVLPFCLPDDFDSPYKSYSAFSANPFFIDLDGLFSDGLLTKGELLSAEQHTPYACEYDRLRKDRLPLLATAAGRVTDRAPIEAFLAEHPHTADFCEFMALRAANGDRPWYEWTKTEGDGDVRFLWQFCQYTFFRQWKKIRDYAAMRGVEVIGDIPMYVDLDSADVWAAPDNFQLDGRHRPTAVAGVPPDYFSEDGQLWGNPLYRFDRMKKDGYRFWRDRMAAMAEWFDGVRIDHFRAIASYYSIPADAKTAKAGTWKRGPGMSLIRALREAAGRTRLIAEDLGDITPDVEALLEKSGLPGMRVLQFGFLDDAPSVHRPHRYPENCVAYTGTHDNNTLLGYMFDASESERRRLLSYCGYEEREWNRPAAYHAVLRALFRSAAATVIVPVQDILLYGKDTRINVPGRPFGNWTYRVTEEQLSGADWTFFKEINHIYERN